MEIPHSPLPTSLAPMEGLTNFPLRLWLHFVGAPASMTAPFVRVTGGEIDPDDLRAALPELFDAHGALPYELTPQLMAASVEPVIRATRMLPRERAPVVELNCGCPSPTCIGPTAGSGALRDAARFGATLTKLCDGLGPGRLAVKMRVGVEHPDEFEALLAQVLRLPLARLTVHGRTRIEGYRGRSRWEAIEVAAARAPYPVIASGDVVNQDTYRRLHVTAPHAQGVMIGRGAMGNPWLFRELATGVATALPSAALVQAMLCFALINELWLKAPQKLAARLTAQRLGSPCGVAFERWQALGAQLASLACGVPRVYVPGHSVPDLPVMPVVAARTKLLWRYLRESLPECYASPRLLRAKTLLELLNGIADAAGPDAVVTPRLLPDS